MVEDQDFKLQESEKERAIRNRDGLFLYIEMADSVETPDINIENIRSLDRPSLVKGLIEKTNIDWEPTLDELKALTCVFLRDKARAYSNYKDADYSDENFPWPEDSKKENSNYISKEWANFIEDDDDDGPLGGDGLFYALGKIIDNLDSKKSADYAEFIFKNSKNLVERNYFPDIVYQITDLATRKLDVESPHSLNAGIEITNFVIDNFDYLTLTVDSYYDEDIDRNKLYEALQTKSGMIDIDNPQCRTNGQFGNEIAAVVTDLLMNQDKLLIRGLANGDISNSELYIGAILGVHGLSDSLNNMKDLYLNEDLSSEREGLERIIKPFWTDVVGDGEFQPNVIAFYDTYGYKDYPLTQSETIKRANMLRQKFKEMDIKPGVKVVDLACGVGLLSEELSDEYDMVGVDINPNHIEEALRNNPDGKYIVGDWFDLSNIKELEGAEVVVIDGRSLPHVNNIDNFYKVMDQCAKLGVKSVIYTFPNPDLGAIGERKEKLKDVLEKYKFNRDWLDHHLHDAVGRLGNNLAQRWLPTEDLLVPATEVTGFEKYEVIHEENYDGKGSENIVFIYKFQEDYYKRRETRISSTQKLLKIRNSQAKNPNGAFNNYSPPINLNFSFSRRES